jgi:hypothetical protein
MASQKSQESNGIMSRLDDSMMNVVRIFFLAAKLAHSDERAVVSRGEGTPVIISLRRQPKASNGQMTDSFRLESAGLMGHYVLYVRNFKYELRRDGETGERYKFHHANCEDTSSDGFVDNFNSKNEGYQMHTIGWTTTNHDAIVAAGGKVFKSFEAKGYNAVTNNCIHFLKALLEEMDIPEVSPDYGWVLISSEQTIKDGILIILNIPLDLCKFAAKKAKSLFSKKNEHPKRNPEDSTYAQFRRMVKGDFNVKVVR